MIGNHFWQTIFLTWISTIKSAVIDSIEYGKKILSDKKIEVLGIIFLGHCRRRDTKLFV